MVQSMLVTWVLSVCPSATSFKVDVSTLCVYLKGKNASHLKNLDETKRKTFGIYEYPPSPMSIKWNTSNECNE